MPTSPNQPLSLLLLTLTLSTSITANPLPYAAPAPLAAPWPQPSQTFDEGSDYGGPSGIDVAGGASGSSGSFHLSTGGIIAIAVVVSLVVILGAASTFLFYLAKKRQWQVRKSISRVSRRITGKVTGKVVLSREEEERRERRHGAVRLAQGKSRAAREKEKAKMQARAAEKGKRAEVGVVEVADMTREKKVGVVMPPGGGK